MTTVIIEIDGDFNRTLLLCDRDISYKELLTNYKKTKKICSKTEEIPVTLKVLLNLKEIKEIEGLKVDYVIDTDPDRLFKPRY